MVKTRKRRRLLDAYTFPGFRPLSSVQGVFGDAQARIVTLARRGKKQFVAPAGRCIEAITTGVDGECGICRAGSIVSGSIWNCGEWIAAVAAW